jgi:hypothetical protein
MSLEYVSGTEFIIANDSIIIFVLNTDELPGSARVIVYQNTAGGGVVFADTGVLNVTPTGSVAIGVSLLTGGFYWLKIFASSSDLVPNAHFGRQQGGQQVTFSSYSPGDFAVFERSRR